MRDIFKYRFLMVLVFCAWMQLIHAQNLVPNGSFEEHYDTCFHPDPFEVVKDWLPKFSHGYINSFSTYSTPNYYTSCLGISNRPPNLNGFYQLPYIGDAFTGIVYHHQFNYHDQEAIRIQLKEPLKGNTCYHAEMYVNYGNNSTYICDKLGMNFSIDSFPMKYDGSILMPTPQVYTNEFIDDTLNWVKIEGNFTASGGEQWLTIGWFFPASEIVYYLTGDTTATGIVTSAYYLIDEVKVYPCTDDEEAVKLPNLITPNGDGKNDVYIIDSLPSHSEVNFFNRWGNEVYSSPDYTNEWDGTYNGHLLPTGTYFVMVQMPHGTRKSTFVELLY